MAPSTLHVPLVKDDLKALGIGVATQNCNFTGCGAYTGEMSADQIKDLGCEWVILGHSERRGEFGLPTPKETNALLKTKLQYVLDQGLSAVFCIGEPLPIREKGIGPVLSVLATQLVDLIQILKALEDKSRVVIAYEPVWAIGTGVAATAEQAQETRGATASHMYTSRLLLFVPSQTRASATGSRSTSTRRRPTRSASSMGAARPPRTRRSSRTTRTSTAS